jgi:hypothetical protein
MITYDKFDSVGFHTINCWMEPILKMINICENSILVPTFLSKPKLAHKDLTLDNKEEYEVRLCLMVFQYS